MKEKQIKLESKKGQRKSHIESRYEQLALISHISLSLSFSLFRALSQLIMTDDEKKKRSSREKMINLKAKKEL